MDRAELGKILEDHKNWITEDVDGWESLRADLRGAKDVWLPLACPEVGSFIAFKKASDYIVKLEIPEDAKRSSATTTKCRASKANVLAILNADGSESDVYCVPSDHDPKFNYEIGKTVEVEDFDEDRWNECSTGIHFLPILERRWNTNENYKDKKASRNRTGSEKYRLRYSPRRLR